MRGLKKNGALLFKDASQQHISVSFKGFGDAYDAPGQFRPSRPALPLGAVLLRPD
jgi:hypothetical protein